MKLKGSILLAPSLLVLALFQNCGNLQSSVILDSTLNKGGTGGVDGKVYAAYTEDQQPCPDGSKVESEIQVNEVSGTAFLLRENCTQISAPINIPVPTKKSFVNSEVVVHEDRGHYLVSLDANPPGKNLPSEFNCYGEKELLSSAESGPFTVKTYITVKLIEGSPSNLKQSCRILVTYPDGRPDLEFQHIPDITMLSGYNESLDVIGISSTTNTGCSVYRLKQGFPIQSNEPFLALASFSSGQQLQYITPLHQFEGDSNSLTYSGLPVRCAWK